MNFDMHKLLTLNISYRLSAAIVLIFFTQASKAQTVSSDQIHLGFLYPLSTHGADAPADTNIFSFHVLAGVSAAEKAFSFSGFSNIIRNDASGFQLAGFSNHLGGKSDGFLFAGFTNTYAEAKGAQFAGFSNVSRGAVEGAQFAGFLNKAGDVSGAQFGGFSNFARNAEGSQFAGFINTSRLFNGSQFAGFSNISGNQSAGSQFAGFINKAGDIEGSQFAGFINVAKKVKGAQFAGFINVADSSEYPVGLINIIKKGEKGVGFSTDENLTTLLSFRSGGRFLYGIIGAGYNFTNKDEFYAFEAGFGSNFHFTNAFRIKTELATVMLESFTPGKYFKSSLRLLPAVKLIKQVELYAGPIFNYVNTNTTEGKALNKHYISTWNSRNTDNFQGIYIGYTLGVHFLF